MLEGFVVLYWQTWALTENLVSIYPGLKDPWTVGLFTAIILSNCWFQFLTKAPPAKAHAVAVPYSLFGAALHIIAAAADKHSPVLKTLGIVLNLKEGGILWKRKFYISLLTSWGGVVGTYGMLTALSFKVQIFWFCGEGDSPEGELGALLPLLFPQLHVGGLKYNTEETCMVKFIWVLAYR